MVEVPFGPMGSNHMPLAERIKAGAAGSQNLIGNSYPDEGHEHTPPAVNASIASSGARPILTSIGSALALAVIIVGFFLWIYQTANRNVFEVPVVKALEKPMRVLPEDPGGRVIAHQDLSINEVIEEGATQAPVSQIELAPGAVTLQPGDVPATLAPPEVIQTPLSLSSQASEDSVAPEQSEEGQEGTAPVRMDSETATASAVDEEATSTLEEAVVPRSEAEETSAPVSPSAPVASAPTASPTALISALPTMRPEGLVQNFSEFSAPPSELPSAAPSAVETLLASALSPSTSHMVQLGVFDSEAAARNDWNRLTIRIGNAFEGKTPIIETSLSGGEMFYRLRTGGFVSTQEAWEFCALLERASENCQTLTLP